ncbi:MAG: DUF4172 domain-containing protein [Bacteroidales bacterium]|nr:DUF4172 domain-containing protein [Bacteroidales bacterium]
MSYIYQSPSWPKFSWDKDLVSDKLAKVSLDTAARDIRHLLDAGICTCMSTKHKFEFARATLSFSI